MDSIPGATHPISLWQGFAFVYAEASRWQQYHRPTLTHIECQMGPTGLDVSSGGQGGAVV